MINKKAKRDYKKLIQKNRDHCDTCALVKEFCICEHTPNITSNLNFILLTHSNELKKRNNTGILIEKSMPTTRLIEWMRKEPSQDLLRLIAEEDELYLLYPEMDEDKNADMASSKESNSKTHNLNTEIYSQNLEKNKSIYIIILDGTWQEAQKIYNRSDYLKGIKRLSLSPDSLSEYKLRRKKDEKHLCTVEAAIICLDMFDEGDNSKTLKEYFEIFQKNYAYSQSH